MRAWATVAGASVLLLAMAMPARASSIVYLDQNDNILMTSPGGSVKRQITTNGSTEEYSSSSMTDAGVIVAGGKSAFFYYYDRDGSSAGGPWTAFDMNCAFEQQPLSNQVAPNGGLNTYWYIDDGSGCSTPNGAKVAFASYNSLTAQGLFATYDGVWYPRWIPGTAYPAAVELGGASIDTLNTSGGTAWITGSGLRYFDITRTGGKVLIAVAHDTSNVNSPSASSSRRTSAPRRPSVPVRRCCARSRTGAITWRRPISQSHAGRRTAPRSPGRTVTECGYRRRPCPTLGPTA